MSEYYKKLVNKKIICTCNGIYSHYNYSLHLKTKKHINYLKQLNLISNRSFIINLHE